ncbi:MAG: GNAT family N-acetyltransferase [Pseudomonadota bacterium]
MATNLQIRRARPDDAGLLAVLGAQTFTETFGHLYTPENLNAFLVADHSPAATAALLADARFAVWVAEEAGEGVGYAVAGPCGLPVEDMEEDAGELKRLYFLNTHHGGGRGTQLLAVALDWLAEAGFAPVYLSVFSENTGAQRLYARHGFEKAGEYDFMVGDHPDREFIFRRS